MCCPAGRRWGRGLDLHRDRLLPPAESAVLGDPGQESRSEPLECGQLLDAPPCPALGCENIGALYPSEVKQGKAGHTGQMQVVVGKPPVVQIKLIPAQASLQGSLPPPLPHFLVASSCCLARSTSHTWKQKERGGCLLLPTATFIQSELH